jgi:hypothetical protein
MVVRTASAHTGTVTRVPSGEAQGRQEHGKTEHREQPRQDMHGSPPFADTIGRDLQGLSVDHRACAPVGSVEAVG